MPVVNNAEIERKAVAYVIDFEQGEGRFPVDTHHKKGAAGDVESDGRIIEIKAYGQSARGQDLWLETRQVDEAERNPNTFWVYVVDNVRQGDPKKFGLRLLGGEQLARLIAKKRAQTTYIVPLPVAEYDSAPAPSAH